jgi:very-short-patch-repair endonuclease
MTTSDFKDFCCRMGLPAPVPEFKFHPTRDWRFDFAWPDKKVAIEVEGGIHTGGRHTQPAGFYKDMEKYNQAAVRGWRILRFTPKGLVSLTTAQLAKEALAA